MKQPTIDPSPTPWRYDREENVIRAADGTEVFQSPSHRVYPIDEANARLAVEAVNDLAARRREESASQV